MRRIATMVLLTCIGGAAVGTVWSQPGRGRSHGFHFGSGPIGHRSGFFHGSLLSGHRFASPFHRFSRPVHGFGIGVDLVRPGHGGFFSGAGFFDGGVGFAPARGASSAFVESWKDRSPLPVKEGEFSGISNSHLLREGMTEEEVVRALGLPLQRARSGGSEFWKFSGYSLLFQDGLLKGIR